MSRPMLGLVVCGVVLAALTLAGLALPIAGSAGSTYTMRMSMLVALMMGAAGTYFLAVRLVLHQTLPFQAIWIVLGIAIVLRLVLLCHPPFLSSDIYRYVWDGRVQAAGINPYRYVPADPALAALRDDTIYPMINRPDYARTIYPPAAQLVFAGVGRIGGGVMAMKLAMLAFEALGMFCITRLLAQAGMPRERLLLYAWNPLPLWSFASDGHVDAIAIGLLGLALLLRVDRRHGWAGAVLAAATLVKLFPVVTAPAFGRGGRLWRPALAGAATVVALYALYSAAGWNVLGFLPAYRAEEGLADGSGFWLLAGLKHLGPLPSWAGNAYVAVALAGLSLWALAIMRRRSDPPDDPVIICRDAALLMAATMVAACPHYPWYFAPLALPCVLAPSRALLWLATAPLILYLHPLDNDFFVWPSLIYLPALGLFVFERWPRRNSRSISLPLAGRSPWKLKQS